ncbi:MAG: hypothetical protein EBR28_13020, partial [Planctomycetia bacterium]|nr:hypothetical protein [Planctomycetia bacterium]
GSWQAGVRWLGDVRSFDEILFVNDSAYGPLFDLRPALEHPRGRAADLWGMVMSSERGAHIQSWCFAMRRPILESPAFTAFWESVVPQASKENVVNRYEVGMSRFFEGEGFRLGALVDGRDEPPPTRNAPRRRRPRTSGAVAARASAPAPRATLQPQRASLATAVAGRRALPQGGHLPTEPIRRRSTANPRGRERAGSRVERPDRRAPGAAGRRPAISLNPTVPHRSRTRAHSDAPAPRTIPRSGSSPGAAGTRRSTAVSATGSSVRSLRRSRSTGAPPCTTARRIRRRSRRSCSVRRGRTCARSLGSSARHPRRNSGSTGACAAPCAGAAGETPSDPAGGRESRWRRPCRSRRRRVP